MRRRAKTDGLSSAQAPAATTRAALSPVDVVFQAIQLQGLAAPDKELKTFGYLLKTVNRLARTDSGAFRRPI